MAGQKAYPGNPSVESCTTLLPNAKDDNFQLIHRAIEGFIEEKRNETAGVEEDRLLLARLLSQLESLKEESDWQLEPNADQSEPNADQSEPNADQSEPNADQSEPNAEQSEIMSRVNAEASGQEAADHMTSTEEIVRELREVKRQNKITHWLLSVLIAVTVVWQLSEVSLILSVKQQVSHPFKTLGGMLTTFFKGKSPLTTDNEGNSSASSNGPHVEVPQLPSLHMPELE